MLRTTQLWVVFQADTEKQHNGKNLDDPNLPQIDIFSIFDTKNMRWKYPFAKAGNFVSCSVPKQTPFFFLSFSLRFFYFQV